MRYGRRNLPTREGVKMAELINLSERLHFHMKKLGLSKVDLAKKVGTTPKSIEHILNGVTKQPKNIVEIAIALGVTAEYLKFGTMENNSIELDFLIKDLKSKELNLYQIGAIQSVVSAVTMDLT